MRGECFEFFQAIKVRKRSAMSRYPVAFGCRPSGRFSMPLRPNRASPSTTYRRIALIAADFHMVMKYLADTVNVSAP